MLYTEIIAVCSHIHTKNTNTLCGQDDYCVMLNHVVYTSILTVYFSGVIAYVCGMKLRRLACNKRKAVHSGVQTTLVYLAYSRSSLGISRLGN
jgi:hypothetical protein